MFTSQPATSTSHWYVLFSLFCMFFIHFCLLFFSLLCPLLSQPSQTQPTPFQPNCTYPFSSPILLSHYIDLLLLLAIFFLTLELHVCKYVDSKYILFLN